MRTDSGSRPQAAGGSEASATFTVPAQPLAFGEHLRLVGSVPEMGDWEPEAGLALEWSEGDNWSAAATLPAGAVEFKVLSDTPCAGLVAACPGCACTICVRL